MQAGSLLRSYAWLPLVLAGGVLLLRLPGKASGIILFSVAAGLLALAALTVGDPCRSELPDTFRDRRRVDVFRSGVLQRSAGSVGLWRYAVALRSASPGPPVLPMYIATSENDPPRWRWRGGDRVCAHSMGKL